MINIILLGCNGYMGRVVTAIALSDDEVFIAAGVDITQENSQNFPVYKDFCSVKEHADVIIDFSNPSALPAMLEYAVLNKVPVVLCTTGYDEKQTASIKEASKVIPVFKSGNMSIGVNLLAQLVRRACAALGENFDIEIIEKHHRRKIDAPSGTALLLADAAASQLSYEPAYVFDRSGLKHPRKETEIGISAVRGGTIVGQHEVIFAGLDEVVELRHTAASRDVFAVGAIRAAKYIVKTNKPGIYDMSDMLHKEG